MDRLVRSRRNLPNEMLVAEDATPESSSLRAFGMMFSKYLAPNTNPRLEREKSKRRDSRF